jgi:hypothetical protein
LTHCGCFSAMVLLLEIDSKRTILAESSQVSCEAALVIARVLFVDGMWRSVHEHNGRQYVFDDDGERVYGVWFIPSNIHREVTMNRKPAGHCFVDPALEEFGPACCPPTRPAINMERLSAAVAALDGLEDLQE